jgi:hypothetical protein
MKLIEKDGPFPFRESKTSTPTEFVLDVSSVDLREVATNKIVVLIYASGHTRTAVWHDVRLEPRIYVQPPADGIWEFVFVGDPTGAKLDVITPVSAEPYVWKNFPPDLKGIRVIAETDTIEKRFEKVFALAS